MISLLEKWMPPLNFVSLLFYIKRKRERHSNTAPYLHCGMVIYVAIIINTCGVYYAENSLNTKKCQRCLQAVKTGGLCWRLIIQTLTCAQLSLVMCVTASDGAKGFHHPPHFPWPRVRDWGATEDESATNPGTYNLRFLKTWIHPVATNGSLREMLADAVSTSVIYYLLVHRFASELVRRLRDLWCCVLVLGIYCYCFAFHTYEYSYFSSF